MHSHSKINKLTAAAPDATDKKDANPTVQANPQTSGPPAVVMDTRKLNKKLSQHGRDIRGYWCNSFVVSTKDGFMLLNSYNQNEPPKSLVHRSDKRVHFVTLADSKNRAATVSTSEIKIWTEDLKNPVVLKPDAQGVSELENVQVVSNKKYLVAKMKYRQRGCYHDSIWCVNLGNAKRVIQNIQLNSSVVALPGGENSTPLLAVTKFNEVNIYALRQDSLAHYNHLPIENGRLDPSPWGHYWAIQYYTPQTQQSTRVIYRFDSSNQLTEQERDVGNFYLNGAWCNGHWIYQNKNGEICAANPENGIVYLLENNPHRCSFTRFGQHILLEREILTEHTFGTVTSYNYSLLQENNDDEMDHKKEAYHIILSETTRIPTHGVRELILSYARNKYVMHPVEVFRPFIPQNLPQPLQASARSFQADLWRKGNVALLDLTKAILSKLNGLTDTSPEAMQQCINQFYIDGMVKDFFDGLIMRWGQVQTTNKSP